MHLAEGILPLAQAAGWSAVAAPALVWSLKGERKASDADPSSTSMIAGATSLLFAATILPIPVPVVGATSHLCLTPVLALIFGLRRVFWPTFFVVLLQAALFAHGGLTTLGVNALVLGWVGPTVTLGLWHILKRMGGREPMLLGIACGLGSVSIYVADALILAAALVDVADPLATFSSVVLGFAPVQVPLAIVEGVVSVGIVTLLANRKPRVLPDPLRTLRTASSVGLVFIVSMSAIVLSGCDYEGVDEGVFEATAETAGRSTTESMIYLGTSEWGHVLTALVLLGLGFVAGRSWERVFERDDDALSR